MNKGFFRVPISLAGCGTQLFVQIIYYSLSHFGLFFFAFDNFFKRVFSAMTCPIDTILTIVATTHAEFFLMIIMMS